MSFKISQGVLTHYIEEPGVTVVRIPDDVRVIRWKTFVHCRKLEALWIPAKTEKIESGAFIGCVNLKKIVVDKRNKNYFTRKGVLYQYEDSHVLGYQLFFCPAGIRKLHIPALVNGIDRKAFSDSINLEKITVSLLNRNYIMKDGLLCTYDMQEIIRCPVNQKKAILSHSIQEIEMFAFADCKELEEIEFSANLATIWDSAFQNCTALKEIHLPSGVTVVGESAFEGCTCLKEMIFPAGAWRIGFNALADCTSLEKVTLPENLSYRTQIFLKCHELKTIVWRNAELNLPRIFREEFERRRTGFFYYFRVNELIQFLMCEERERFNKNKRLTYSATLELFFSNLADKQKEKAFIESHFMDTIKYLIDENQPERIKMLMESMNSCFNNDNTQEFIMYANEKQKYEIQVMLMDYKARHFGNESQEEIIRRKFEL